MTIDAGRDMDWWVEDSDGPGPLFDAIEGSLHRGDLESALRLLRSMRCRFVERVDAPPTSHSGFTAREAATLALLADASLSQKDMARVLGISHNTLKTHLRAVYQKLGAHSRGEAIERSGIGGHGSTVAARRHLAAV